MPPNASVGTEYGFDQSGNRHGGASLMQPMQTISTVSHTAPSLLAVRQRRQRADRHRRRHRADLSRDGRARQHRRQRFRHHASFSDANDYFTQGENTPPYFGGFHYMRFCNVPDDATTRGTGVP